MAICPHVRFETVIAASLSTTSERSQSDTTCPSVAPDLVVLGLTMPGLDEFRACQFVRSDPDTAGHKILALPGLAEPSSIERNLRRWADGATERRWTHWIYW